MPEAPAPDRIAHGGTEAPQYAVEKSYEVLESQRASFKRAVESDLQVQALENAVHGAHQNLMDYLGRQVASN